MYIHISALQNLQLVLSLPPLIPSLFLSALPPKAFRSTPSLLLLLILEASFESLDLRARSTNTTNMPSTASLVTTFLLAAAGLAEVSYAGHDHPLHFTPRPNLSRRQAQQAKRQGALFKKAPIQTSAGHPLICFIYRCTKVSPLDTLLSQVAEATDAYRSLADKPELSQKLKAATATTQSKGMS